MPARTSVVIGLGTTGSEVVAKVYHAYQNHIAKTQDNPNTVQFMMIDTQDTLEEAKDLLNSHLMIGFTNGERIRKALWAEDPFFKEWWPEKYKNIGPCYPGAGTVPIKGRMCFWWTLGNPNNQENFQRIFEDLALRANKDAPKGAGQQILVYIISTLCGGTGAGTFLDVAQIIKNITGVEVLTHGIFIMPDIVHMRAETSVHDQTSANAYGALIGLNYWCTSEDSRPLEISPFMKKGPVEIKGVDVPYDIAWLISRQSKEARALQSIEEYQQMIADAVSMMLFEEVAGNVQSRFNDFEARISQPLQWDPIPQPQPRRYASFGAYTLRYSPMRATQYLTGSAARSAIDTLFKSSEKVTQLIEPIVKEFLKHHALREMDDLGNGSTMNEVTERLSRYDQSGVKIFPRMEKYISSLKDKPPRTFFSKELNKTSVNTGTVTKFKEEVEAGLTGTIQGDIGVNYQRTLEENRNALYAKVLNNRVSLTAGQQVVMAGLYQLIEMILKSSEEGMSYQGAVRLLEMIKAELPKHRLSLETELKGNKEKGMLGDEDTLSRYEANFGNYLKKLASDKSRLFASSEAAVGKFEENWWKPWLATKLRIMQKREAILFYKQLEDALDWQIGLMKDLESSLKRIRAVFDQQQAQLYTGGINVTADRLEEEAIRDGAWLIQTYNENLERAIPVSKEIIAEVIVNALQNVRDLPDKTLQGKRKVMTEMETLITKALQKEGEERFRPILEDLSLWDAMVLGIPKSDNEAIRNMINARISQVKAHCTPYWKLDPRFFAKAKDVSFKTHFIEAYSYDKAALESFKALHEISQLAIGEASKGTTSEADIIRFNTVYKASAHELKVIVGEGGVPLAFIDGVTDNRAAFELMYKQPEPVLLDKRYQKIIDQMGINPWEPEPRIQDLYYLLMAEQLKIFDTPLVRTHNTNGPYLYPEHKPPRQRKAAFQYFLDPGPVYDKVMPEIKKAVDTKETDEFNEPQWELQHLLCFDRLRMVYDLTPNTETGAKQLLSIQMEAFLSKVNDLLGWDKDKVIKLATERNVREMIENEIQK